MRAARTPISGDAVGGQQIDLREIALKFLDEFLAVEIGQP
jgi:hypothetical protein